MSKGLGNYWGQTIIVGEDETAESYEVPVAERVDYFLRRTYADANGNRVMIKLGAHQEKTRGRFEGREYFGVSVSENKKTILDRGIEHPSVNLIAVLENRINMLAGYKESAEVVIATLEAEL